MLTYNPKKENEDVELVEEGQGDEENLEEEQEEQVVLELKSVMKAHHQQFIAMFSCPVCNNLISGPGVVSCCGKTACINCLELIQ